MAFSPFSSSHRESKLRSEINVTPFVDVMLVLLVIFMVTAPMMQSQIKVNLPTGGKATCETVQTIPLTVVLNKNGELFFRDKATTWDGLLEALSALSAQKEDPIHIEADKELAYEQVIQLMAQLSQAGFHRLVLVTHAGASKASKKKGKP